MKCKQCGAELKEFGDDGQAYCPYCLVRRRRNPLEIDPETGEWEGMKHGYC